MRFLPALALLFFCLPTMANSGAKPYSAPKSRSPLTARGKNIVYLNFGDDPCGDFTIAIATHDLRDFHTANIDLLALKRKTVRIRGWIKKNFGSMIAAINPARVEVPPN